MSKHYDGLNEDIKKKLNKINKVYINCFYYGFWIDKNEFYKYNLSNYAFRKVIYETLHIRNDNVIDINYNDDISTTTTITTNSNYNRSSNSNNFTKINKSIYKLKYKIKESYSMIYFKYVIKKLMTYCKYKKINSFVKICKNNEYMYSLN